MRPSRRPPFAPLAQSPSLRPIPLLRPVTLITSTISLATSRLGSLRKTMSPCFLEKEWDSEPRFVSFEPERDYSATTNVLVAGVSTWFRTSPLD